VQRHIFGGVRELFEQRNQGSATFEHPYRLSRPFTDGPQSRPAKGWGNINHGHSNTFFVRGLLAGRFFGVGSYGENGQSGNERRKNDQEFAH
jgi:hypothetical protein